MSVAPAEPPPPTEPPAAAPAPSAPAPTLPPAAPAPPAIEPKSNPWDDPATAQAEIEKLRRENAKDRTTAKAQAAAEAQKELATTIGKALGFVVDEPVDPAKLPEQLATTQAEAKQARVELAVFRNAATAGGDPAALLDSASFLASLAVVDPTDAAAVTAAIQSAVTTNPRLGAAPAGPQPPAPNPAQGSSASGASSPGQLAEADLKNMTPEEIAKAHEEGRFEHLLNPGR